MLSEGHRHPHSNARDAVDLDRFVESLSLLSLSPRLAAPLAVLFTSCSGT